MPDCKPFSLLCTKNFLALAGSFLVTIAQGGGGLSGGLRGMLGAADVGGARRGGLPALSPADLAFCFLSCPYPPSPLPLRGRGRPKVYFAGGFAPGTPALNRLRHLQSLPSRYPVGGLPPALPARRALTVPTGGVAAGTRHWWTVPAAKERGDRGRGTSAFEMVLSPGAGRANAGGVQPPAARDS